MPPRPSQPLALPAPWHYHQGWAWSCDPGGKAFVPPGRGGEMLSEGGFGVPREPLILALFGSTCSHQPALVPPCSSVFGQSPGAMGALGWDGAQIPPTVSPPPWPTFPAGLALDTQRHPPTPPEPLWALCHQPHLLLGGDKSPGQPILTSLPLCPRREVTVSPQCLRGCSETSGGTRFRLAGLWCQNSAFPAPGHREAALLWGCGGQHHQCQAEGSKGNPH